MAHQAAAGDTAWRPGGRATASPSADPPDDRERTPRDPGASAADAAPGPAATNGEKGAGGPEEGEPQVRIPTDIRSAALTLLAVLASIYLLKAAQEVFIPIVLGVLISYALDPLVIALQRWRVPRLVAAAVVLAGVTAGAGYLVYELRDEAAQIVQQLPEAARKLRLAMRESQNGDSAMKKVQQAAREIERTAQESSGQAQPARGVQRVEVTEPIRVSDYLWWGSMGAVAFLGELVTTLFFSFFLLVAGDMHKRKLVRIAGPTLSKKKITVQILDEINAQVERFLIVRVLTSILVALATWLALWWVGVEQAPVWGVLAGVFNSIPYFGPIIVSGGLAVVGFVQFGTIGMALYVAGIALVITSLEGWLITPPLSGKATRMNEVAVFIGLLFWGWVWGVWGVILAVPMMIIVKAVCDRIEEFQWIGELLGD